ncbi:hypothetical protein FJZ36_19195, partial [Candidatus Poribacteria bacterium]|nr:hypothetical protein [Candidatus Poribacteria bacterium]
MPARRLTTVLLLTLHALAAHAAAPEIQRVGIDPSGPVTIGDPITVRVRIAVPHRFVPTPALPDTSNRDLSWSAPQSKRLSASDDGDVWEIAYGLQVFRVGETALPRFEIGVGNDVLTTTEVLTVTVQSVRTGDDAEILRPARDPVSVRQIAWTRILIAGIAALGIAVAWLVRRRRRRRDELPTTPREPTASEWLEARFAEMERMEVGDAEWLRRYVARVADIVREYIARLAQIPAPRRTTRVTLNVLARELSP